MRAVSVSSGVDMQRIMNAAILEIDSHSKSFGGLSGAVLVMSVRVCCDEEKENGAGPPRETQPR